jgi:cytidine deaminase
MKSSEKRPTRSDRLRRLIEVAIAARGHAYAPYSRYRVGAAIECASGAVFAGCNVENSSFGATLCAERSAIAQMVLAGERHPVLCAVVTGGKVPGSPCGICRQVLYEFTDDMPIVLVAVPSVPTKGSRGVSKLTRHDTTLAALLPLGFRRQSHASGRRGTPG